MRENKMKRNEEKRDLFLTISHAELTQPQAEPDAFAAEVATLKCEIQILAKIGNPQLIQ